MTVDPEKAIVLWPSYFDSRVGRDAGRRVPRKDAVEAPTANMLFEAVKGLGLDCVLELEKSFPRYWHRHEGRVLVEPKLKKRELLVKVSAKLKAMPRPKA
ncbi:MAG: signal recognition particle protein Srp19 [Thermoplasmata archaeon]|jgi:signal recognition particle subunit SRP19|nr:signal recognition particle protein Srp19 [Thermoplasmata archaeon]